MRLTYGQLANQVTEFTGRDGRPYQVKPFKAHREPPSDPVKSVRFRIPTRRTAETPDGLRTIIAEDREHGIHAVVIRTEIGDKSFLVRCDGTIVSSQG